MGNVVFVDTSVLCDLLAIPGKCQGRDSTMKEYQERRNAGDRFVIPISAVVETGNHIAHAPRGRRECAKHLVKLLGEATQDGGSWMLNQVDWGPEFIGDLCGGGLAGSQLVNLLGNATFGTGDVAILVELQRFRRTTIFREAVLWSHDYALADCANAPVQLAGRRSRAVAKRG